MLCPNCQSENREKAKFCDECGFPLTGAIARAASAVAEQGEEAQQGEPLAAESNDVLVDESAEAHESHDDETVDEQGASFEDASVQVVDEASEVQFDEQSGSEAQPTQAGPEAQPTQVGQDSEIDSLPAQETAQPEADSQPTQVIGQAASDFQPTQVIAPSASDSQPTQVIGQSEGSSDITQVIGSVASAAPATRPIGKDLSGFDREAELEGTFVNDDFAPAPVSWRDGGTLKMDPVASEESSNSKDYLASATAEKKSHKGRAIAIVIAALVVLAGVLAFATYQMQIWGGKAVPNVVGMTEADARSVLEGDGFTVKTLQVKSDETEGLVLIMDPSEGSRIDEGSEVSIHLATARTVPEIIGKTKEEAESALANDGFENYTFELEKSDAQENTVISVSPEVGERAKSAQPIVVKVADPYVVPDVSTMYLEDAQNAIQEAGLTSVYYFVNTEEYPDGLIMGTTPAAGEKVTHDTVVEIQIARARGPELVSLTQNYLAPGAHITMGMYNYEIESVTSTEYIGDDSVSFTANARPFTSILGETVYISSRPISGTIKWTEDNSVASIS